MHARVDGDPSYNSIDQINIICRQIELPLFRPHIYSFTSDHLLYSTSKTEWVWRSKGERNQWKSCNHKVIEWRIMLTWAWRRSKLCIIWVEMANLNTLTSWNSTKNPTIILNSKVWFIISVYCFLSSVWVYVTFFCYLIHRFYGEAYCS